MTSATLQFAGSHAHGWECRIPESVETFMGEPIGVWAESADDDSGPDPGLAALLDQILRDLPTIIETARSELARYEEGAEDNYSAHFRNPHIWLTVDLVPDDPSAWTFVVERDDWPSFGWHIEFRGTRFHDIWAGD